MPQRPEGLVLRIDARSCHVQVGERVLEVPLRGRLFESREVERSPLAVGDRVYLGPEDQAVEERLPRRSQLARAAAGEGSREQVLAANVDQVLVVASMRLPDFRPSIVDRVLAGAERQGLAAVVVITKLDLATPAEHEPVCGLYRSLGYPVVATSVRGGQGIDELARHMGQRISVVCGLSGVGKSSLLNAMEPGLRLKVGDVGQRSQEGRHTTTCASLLPLRAGGHVVDTPGVRNFGLLGLTAEELPWLFREITTVGRECAFRDCRHRSESACAVRRALGAGVAHSRHESYLELLAELEEQKRQGQRRQQTEGRRARPARGRPATEEEEEE